MEKYSDEAVPINEINRWCGLSCIDDRWKGQIRCAFIFDEVSAFVTTDDDFYLVGKNVSGSLGGGDAEIYSTKVPKKIEILCGKRVVNFAFGSQKKVSDDGKKCFRLSLFAVTEDGNVFGWGSNENGSLGLRYSSATPVPPCKVVFSTARHVPIVQVACGGGHSLALSRAGEVWAWGRNIHGQVGNGNPQDHLFPVQIRVDKGSEVGVASVATGRSHSVALMKDGRVFTWGNNAHGQLGIGLEPSEEGFCLTPTQVVFPGEAGPMRQIACGKRHTLALSRSGYVFAWGSNDNSQLGNGKPDDDMEYSSVPILCKVAQGIDEIAAVSHLSVSVCKSEASHTYMWGKLYEQSGKSISEPWETFMKCIQGIFSSFVVPAATYRPISAECVHPFARHPAYHQDLAKWGGLKFIYPKFLERLKLAFVCGIGFEQTTILVSVKGDVMFVGQNVHGSLGTGVVTKFETRLPVKNEELSGKSICSITFGLDVNGGIMCLFALTELGTVYSWGYNEFGELGLGFESEGDVAITPTKIQGDLSNVFVSQLASGSDHILAISNEGVLYGWGYNYFGQCGTGHPDTCVPSPARVRFKTGHGIRVVCAAAGMFHSVAVTNEGHVYAWGKNEQSQLGGATKELYKADPVRVRFPAGVNIVKVYCGPDCTFVISSRGHLYFWGYCDFNKNAATAPTRVCNDLGEIIDVGTAHWSSVYAIQTGTGQVYMWGRLRGQKTVVKNPIECVKANSVSDVFVTYSNPAAMIRPIFP